MIAYNKARLEYDWIRDELAQAYQEGCIDKDEYNAVRKIYEPGFYTPAFLVAVGLFLVSAVILVFSFTLVTLSFPIGGTAASYGIAALFFGGVVYFLLELMVSRGHFRSGVDDALIWGSMIFLYAGCTMCFEPSSQISALLVLVLGAWFSIRFIESPVTVVAFLALIALLVISLEKAAPVCRASIPWLIMGISWISYYIFSRMRKAERWRYYRHCLLAGEIVSLSLLYLAGNFFLVTNMAKTYLRLDILQVLGPMAYWIFWTLTWLVPGVYLLLGLIGKDAVKLRLGLIGLAISFCTLHYYYHPLPTEITLLLAGALLILFSYLLLRWLQLPRFGFHVHQRVSRMSSRKQQLESVLIGQLLKSGPQAADSGQAFGGGSGGGAGAGGEF